MIKKILMAVALLTTLSASAEAPKYAYITDEVNIPMRSTRSFNDNIVKMLTTGDRLKVIRYFDGWTQVRYAGETGWISSRYLSIKEPVKNRLRYFFEDNRSLKLKVKALERKLELFKENEALKASILLEKSQEIEIQMEDLLNEAKANYINNIVSRIKKQWRYHGAKDNWGCDVYILQDLNGKVQSVKLQLCNVGNSAKAKVFKDSIERSVYKASPLPKAPIKEVFDKEILFHFKVN